MSSAYEIGGSLSVVHGTHSRGEHEPDWRSAASSVTGTRYEPPHSRAHAALRSSLAWQFNRPRLYGLDELRTAALKIGRRPADVVTHMNDTIWAAAKIWAVILERDPEYRALMCAYLNCADPYFVIENHHGKPSLNPSRTPQAWRLPSDTRSPCVRGSDRRPGT